MNFARLSLLIPFIILSNGCIAQQVQTKNESLEKLSNESKLNNREVELLNSLLEISRDTFNFEEKRVAFITGSSGNRILSKVGFFETCINPWTEKGEKPQIFMVQLNEKEKIQSSGYDVLVLAWVKVFTKKKRIIKLLGK